MTTATPVIDPANYRPDAVPTAAHAFRGTTIRRGGIIRFIPAPPPQPPQPPPTPQANPEQPEQPSGFTQLALEARAARATDKKCRQAHAAWTAGTRDPLTDALNREWERRYRAARRAGRGTKLSAEDRAWAEKAAVVGSWRAPVKYYDDSLTKKGAAA